MLSSLLGNPEYEIGGILGSRDGYAVTDFVLDIPESKPDHPCVYAPNVGFLNDRIETWQHDGIHFMGLFHTHFAGVRTLSCLDMQYINKIMLAMPEGIQYLYFPLFVLPERELVAFKAERREGKVLVVEERVQLR